jgi:hypothetical protein
MKVIGIAGLRLSAALACCLITQANMRVTASLSTLRDLSKRLTLCHMLSSKLPRLELQAYRRRVVGRYNYFNGPDRPSLG